MSEKQISFRDKLIEQETLDPLNKAKAEKEIKDMIESKITTPKRISLYVVTSISSVMTVLFMYILLTVHLPLMGNIGLGIGILFSALSVIWAAGILKRGVYNQRRDSSSYTALIWCFLVLMVTIFMMMAPNMPGTKGIELLAGGTIFLLFGVVTLITGKMDQQELNTKEKLLEIQIQLAEIKEKLK